MYFIRTFDGNNSRTRVLPSAKTYDDACQYISCYPGHMIVTVHHINDSVMFEGKRERLLDLYKHSRYPQLVKKLADIN